MSRGPKVTNRLEREVIVAVIVLYLIICAGMLAVHYAALSAEGGDTSSARHE